MAELLFRCRLPEPARAVVAAWEAGGDAAMVLPEGEEPLAYRSALARAEVLVHVLEPVTEEVLAAAPRLRLVQKLGTGVNTIDLAAAARRGVAVCNMPGANAPAVAEHALALILAALRRLPALTARSREPRGWAEATAGALGELGARTLGLVGAGAVAQRLAHAADSLGARVLYASRTPRSEMPGAHVPLAELLPEAGILSLHVPLAPQTERLIDAAALAALPPGAILVNTARGGIVDEDALLAALASGHLAAAALDVLRDEPPSPNHPLLRHPRVIVTPHAAWLTPETWTRCLAVLRANLDALATGTPLRNRVA